MKNIHKFISLVTCLLLVSFLTAQPEYVKEMKRVKEAQKKQMKYEKERRKADAEFYREQRKADAEYNRELRKAEDEYFREQRKGDEEYYREQRKADKEAYKEYMKARKEAMKEGRPLPLPPNMPLPEYEEEYREGPYGEEDSGQNRRTYPQSETERRRDGEIEEEYKDEAYRPYEGNELQQKKTKMAKAKRRRNR